ncbi:MAG: aspartate kinase [Syntrophomonadaceae bacterium]|nr:aspartate kinase [Syntrophomonadaceae bacterium]
MALLVCKFGGSSVATLDRIKNIAARVQKLKHEYQDVVVVVSAMGDTTDDLLVMAQEIGNDLSCRELDMLLSTGEQQSAALLALTLNSIGIKAISLTGWQAGIKSDSAHSKAKISAIDNQRIRDEFKQGNVVVVAGFQGINCGGDITTLGRGGSDTTAVALAASLKADRCMIFTDVSGVYSADPRLVHEARKIERISYEEMLEMASLGAAVMQPRSVEFAMVYGVDVEVRSSFSEEPGTIITEDDGMEQQKVVQGIAHDRNCAKIAIFDVPDRPGIAKALFTSLAEHKINVDMVIQAAMRDEVNDIAFTIERNELNMALPVVEDLVKEIGASGMSYGDNVAKISVVGAGMKSNPGVAAAVFTALADASINIQMISTSEIKISCIIEESQVTEAVQALHNKFDLDK